MGVENGWDFGGAEDEKAGGEDVRFVVGGGGSAGAALGVDGTVLTERD